MDYHPSLNSILLVIISIFTCFYSHKVRSLYLEHYQRQRRLLNLDQPGDGAGGANALADDFMQRGLLGRVLGH